MHPYLYKDKFKFEVIVRGKFQNRGHILIVMMALKIASLSEQVLSLELSPNCEEVGGGGQDIRLRRLKLKNGCNERSFIFFKQSKYNVKIK